MDSELDEMTSDLAEYSAAVHEASGQRIGHDSDYAKCRAIDLARSIQVHLGNRAALVLGYWLIAEANHFMTADHGPNWLSDQMERLMKEFGKAGDEFLPWGDEAR